MTTPDTARAAARAIAEHVDRPTSATLDLDSVKVRARTIRRRRRVTTAAATLAVVAAATPLAFWGSGPTDRSDLQPAERAQVTLSADAPRGDAPRTAWAGGGLVTLPGAEPVPLPGDVGQVERLGDGFVVTTTLGSDRVLRFEGADGEGFLRPVTQSVAVNRERDLLAYVTPQGEVTVSDAEGTQTVLARVGATQYPVSVEGTAECATTGDGCTVLLAGDGIVPPLQVSSGAKQRLEARGNVLTAASTELRSFLVSRRGTPDTCSEVLPIAEDKAVWTSCKLVVRSFSPDGRWGLAVDTDSDGLGARRMFVVDARTGEVVVTADVDGQTDFITSGTWEDDGHVLLSTYGAASGRWHLHRVGIDGTVEQTIDPVTGPEVPPAVVSETLP